MDDAKLGEVQALGGTAIKPIGWDRTGWEAFHYMLYNPDTGEVLTRTPLSWLKITVFYCIYYTFLAGFWIGCLHIFFATLPDPTEGPKWKQDNSLIGINPGVGLRPRNNDKDIDSQMFILRAGDTNLFPSQRGGEGILNADYAERMKKYLTVYDNKDMNMDYPVFEPSTELKECSEHPYGYVGEVVSPCIFVKLNAIWGWTPKPYNQSNPEMPESLKTHLNSKDAKDAGADNIWIDCKGRYAADQEALADGIEYFPKGRNIPIKYYPYFGKTKNDKGEVLKNYHSPLVAIKVTPNAFGQMVHIECRAYYEGVKHVTKTKEGLVQFEVQIKKD